MKLLLLLLAFSLPAAADWTKELAPSHPGRHPKLGAVTLLYTLSWKGMIDAGSLEFCFGQADPDQPGDYTVLVSGESSGLASKLFPYKLRLTSHLDPARLRPRHFRGFEVEGQEITITDSVFDARRVSSTELNRPNPAAPQRKWSSSFTFAPAFDACSAILQVRSQPLKDGDTLKYALVPFNNPYLATIHVLDHEQHMGRDAIRLSVAMQKIDPATLALLPYKKLKSATLWITDDVHRVPLELRSEVFVGDVRMTLTGMKPH